MKLDWEIWFYGLGNCVVGGIGTSGSAYMGMTAAKALGANVPTLNWEALGIICLSGALTNLFFYLKQSPLPKMEVTTIIKTTETTSEKTVTSAAPDNTPQP
jgi:hypothetical protein